MTTVKVRYFYSRFAVFRRHYSILPYPFYITIDYLYAKLQCFREQIIDNNPHFLFIFAERFEIKGITMA
uniref:Uncharacterized protein n=1 Tax=virus sp. ct5rm7 TaxID=2827298 RepID=A0A8S5RGP6_9VIRU|nr:MAG TPA: hypothetical protein [virus sp. ct5rm7]